MSRTTIPLIDLFIAFTSSKPTHYKAIAGLLFTSSMNVSTIAKLTLNDLLKSCNDYFDENEDKTLKNLLKKDPMTIIPSWNIEYKKQLTFNTPETSFFIFAYLKEKRSDDLNDLEQPLFKTITNKSLSPSKISSHISEFNNVLRMHHEHYENNFKSKNLINTFKYICEKNIPFDNKSKDILISLFSGNNGHSYDFYKLMERDIIILKKAYQNLIPFLTAKNYDNPIPAPTINNSQPYTYNRIVEYYYKQLKSDMNLDYKKESILCNLAYTLSKNQIFENTDQYLDSLFKKSQVKLIIDENEKFMINRKYLNHFTTNEKLAEHLTNDLLEMKLDELVKINEITLYKYIIHNLFKNDFYDKSINNFEAKRIIEESLFEIIDNEKRSL